VVFHPELIGRENPRVRNDDLAGLIKKESSHRAPSPLICRHGPLPAASDDVGRKIARRHNK
jgi:hypothetical protein